MQATEMDAIRPDFHETRRFLDTLEPGGRFTFQTFDDGPEKRGELVRQHHGTLSSCWDTLAMLNQQGAGVFVCLNATDGQGRKSANITAVRGVFVDFDDPDPDRLPRLAGTLADFPPSLIVESSPSRHHVYWLADGLVLDEFTRLQKVLATWLESDPKVSDLPRVVRLPGFIHRKRAPFVTRVMRVGNRTTADAVRQALALHARKASHQPLALTCLDTSHYALKALEGASAAISTAVAGTRNDVLNREAFSVFRLVKAGHLDEGKAHHALELAASVAGLPVGEVAATLASAWNAAEPCAAFDWLTPATAPTLRDKPPANDESVFGFVSAGELMARLKPISWLVKGYVETDSLALVFGEPGHGKSFLALDWGACVATGIDWHGHPTRQGAVFVVAGEGHNGIARRLKAWELARGVNLAEAPLFISHASASLADWGSACEVVRAIEKLAKDAGQAPALIIVDTLSRNLGPADENSSADMAAFIRHLDAMRQQWQATVCVVHHSGKDKAKGARGSTVLKGAVDAEYSIAKDEAGVVCLEATKMKDAELPGMQTFKLVSVKLPLLDDEGRDVPGAALEVIQDYQPTARGKSGRGKNQTKALAALRALYEERRDQSAADGTDPAKVLIDDWRDVLAGEGITRQRFHDVKSSLERAALVKLQPPYVELVR